MKEHSTVRPLDPYRDDLTGILVTLLLKNVHIALRFSEASLHLQAMYPAIIRRIRGSIA